MIFSVILYGFETYISPLLTKRSSGFLEESLKLDLQECTACWGKGETERERDINIMTTYSNFTLGQG